MNKALQRNVFFIFLGSLVCLVGFLFAVASSFFSYQVKSDQVSDSVITDVQSQKQEASAATTKPVVSQNAPAQSQDNGVLIKEVAGESKATKVISASIPLALYALKATAWIDRSANNSCSLTIGSESGVRVGMIFNIFDSDNNLVGQVKIENSDDGISIGKIISDATKIQGNYFTAQLSKDTNGPKR